MRIWSVVTRELRVQARQPFTYWLRVIGLILLLAGGALYLEEDLFGPNVGGLVFGAMHFICYLALWVLIPLSAADCISRERRDGTLGLLFLTPLRPVQIVVAKSVAHALRAATLVIAVIPAFTIPFLIGGVQWQQVLISLIVNLNVLCWGTAAALIASAVSRTANRAIALAMVFSTVGFVSFPWTTGAVVGMGSISTWTGGYTQGAYDFFSGFAIVGMPRLNYATIQKFVPAAQLAFAFTVASVVSIGVLVIAVLVAANRIRNTWRELPPSARREKIERTFCEPRFGRGLLRRWMRHKLERNPIGWLEQRRWTGRMVTWVWFAIIISVYSMVLSDRTFFRGFEAIHDVIAWALALSMAATAAGSFRRERETGVLELLLVTPLRSGSILSGRLRGLWGQFAPAVIGFLLMWAYLLSVLRGFQYITITPQLGDLWFFAASYAVLPVMGLYFSLRCHHFLAAIALTVAVTFLVPAAVVTFGRALVVGYDNGVEPTWGESFTAYAWVVQFLLAGWMAWGLKNRLDRRAFPLQQSLQ